MNKTLKIIIALVVVLAIIFIGYALITKNNNKQVQIGETKEPIKIGFIAPLTGEAASWGQNALAGVSLAIKEMNETGGINGSFVELIAEDDQCKPTAGVSAINKLINIDQVSAVLTVCAASTGAILPVVQERQIPTILILASTPDFTKIGDYIFRVNPSDAQQAIFGADFIFNQLEKKNVAIIYVKNESGEGMRKGFNEYFQELGGKIVYESGIQQTEKDIKTELSKIKNSGADVLFFPVYPANAVAGLKQIKELQLDVPVIGYAPFGGKEVVESDFSDGVMFTSPKIASSQEFEDRLHTIAGFENIKIQFSAPLGYDAAKIIILALRRGGVNKNEVKEALNKTNYNGVSSSLIQFDQNGDILNPVFEMKIINNKQVSSYLK